MALCLRHHISRCNCVALHQHMPQYPVSRMRVVMYIKSVDLVQWHLPTSLLCFTPMPWMLDTSFTWRKWLCWAVQWHIWLRVLCVQHSNKPNTASQKLFLCIAWDCWLHWPDCAYVSLDQATVLWNSTIGAAEKCKLFPCEDSCELASNLLYTMQEMHKMSDWTANCIHFFPEKLGSISVRHKLNQFCTVKSSYNNKCGSEPAL